MTSLEESSKARTRIANARLPEPSSFSDLRWCSKRRSEPRKRIGEEKLRRFQGAYQSSALRMRKVPRVWLPYDIKVVGGKGPRVQLKFSDDGLCVEEEIRCCVETALSSWNVRRLVEQETEYELVEPLSALRYYRRRLYHCNFIARPKHGCEAENKLFFAELEYIRNPVTLHFVLCCHFCCILGPSGYETGLDCDFCGMYPGRVQHPEGGGFTQVFRRCG